MFDFLVKLFSPLSPTVEYFISWEWTTPWDNQSHNGYDYFSFKKGEFDLLKLKQQIYYSYGECGIAGITPEEISITGIS